MTLHQVAKGDFFGDTPRKVANQPIPNEEDEVLEDLKWAEPGLCLEELLFSEGDIPLLAEEDAQTHHSKSPL